MDDAFAVQSEIAQRIVAAVGVTLTGAEAGAIRMAPTQDATAYQLHLQGLEYSRRPALRQEDNLAAQQLYERALALDSTFAPAHAALALSHQRTYHLGNDGTPTRLALAQREAETALRLAPGLPQGHLALGLTRHWARNDFRAALDEFNIALRGAPNDAELWGWVGRMHRHLGNWDSVAIAFNHARRLDPRNANLVMSVGNILHYLHRYEEAIEAYREAHALAPDFLQARLSLAWSYILWKGERDTLRAILRDLPLDDETGGGGGTILMQRLILLQLDRRPDSILSLLHAPVSAAIDSLDRTVLTAKAQAMRGDSTVARAALASALVIIDSLLRTSPDELHLHAERGLLLARLGRRTEALGEARWLERSDTYRNDRYGDGDVIGLRALILGHARDTEAVLAETERVLARPSGTTVHMIRLDPSWDPIRSDPRFQALLVKYANPGLVRR